MYVSSVLRYLVAVPFPSQIRNVHHVTQSGKGDATTLHKGCWNVNCSPPNFHTIPTKPYILNCSLQQDSIASFTFLPLGRGCVSWPEVISFPIKHSGWRRHFFTCCLFKCSTFYDPISPSCSQSHYSSCQDFTTGFWYPSGWVSHTKGIWKLLFPPLILFIHCCVKRLWVPSEETLTLPIFTWISLPNLCLKWWQVRFLSSSLTFELFLN